MIARRLIVTAAVALLLITGCGSDGGLLANLDESREAQRPNIVVIMTDDQDLLLDSMEYMPQVEKLLTRQGTTFSNFIVNLPLCCPARAMMLRGEYPHNNGIMTNLWPTGGFAKAYATGLEHDTVATALQSAGYRTALLGKYLNGYPLKDQPTYVPPGWDKWWAPITDSAYGSYDYQVNHDGQIEDYGSAPEDYITDVMLQRAVSFITETVTLSPTQPFFLAFNVYAPHSPARAAPRHSGLFADVKAPRTPSFNEEDVSDKAPFMQATEPLTAEQIEHIDGLYRARLQSLQAVDEAVAALVQTLKETDQLDNTYIIFLSDNGFHMGQHRMAPGKGMPYEEDIRAPLIIRGPGVRKNAVRDELVSIIDLAPTLAEIAGAQMTNSVDGRSLLPLLGKRRSDMVWRQSLLLEHFSAPSREENETLSDALEPLDADEVQRARLQQAPPDYAGLRTERYTYIQRIGAARELYDLNKDPHQLENQWPNADPQFQTELAAFLDRYVRCVGAACREVEELPPPEFRLIKGS
jgi:N-acetylglucosamine-6-sulfatase